MNSSTVKIVLKIVTLLIMICFFLPYFSVSCEGIYRDVSGLNLATGVDMGYGYREEGSPIFFVLLIIPAIAALFLFFNKGKKAPFVATTVIYVTYLLCLVILYNAFVSYIEEQWGGGYGYVKDMYGVEIGYIGACVGTIICLIGGIYGAATFKEEKKRVVSTSQSPPTSQSPKQNRKFCVACGEALESEDKFCPNCGERQ